MFYQGNGRRRGGVVNNVMRGAKYVAGTALGYGTKRAVGYAINQSVKTVAKRTVRTAKKHLH